MKRLVYILIISLFALTKPQATFAQIGAYRNDFSLGVNGGVMLANVGFSPKVTQKLYLGYQGGLSARYVCEKYFSMICSICAEVNYAQMGWKENIVDLNRKPVYNEKTGQNDMYERRMNYIQLPIMAHLAFGKEYKGVNFFIELGPQFGYLLNEKTKTNFTLENANIEGRSNKTVEQYKMSVQNRFDYGICGGLGLEFSHPSVGHFLLAGRYYFGLGNIYKSTKSDYFSKSNLSGIEVKLTYLIDLKKTKY